MKDYLRSFRILFPAHLALTLALVPVYGLIRYFTLVPVNSKVAFQFSRGAWDFAIPIILVSIVYIFYYRHILFLVEFKKESDRRRDGLAVFSFFTGFLVLLLTSMYIEEKFGKLSKLEFPSYLALVDQTTFYQFEFYEIPQNWGAMNARWYTSGKYNTTLHFEILFASPFLNTTFEMIPEVPHLWYGVRFQESMSNRASQKEKELRFKDFEEQSLKKIETWDFQQAIYFKRVPKSEHFLLYNSAIANRVGINNTNQFIILEAKLEPFENRVGNKGLWIFYVWLIGTAVFSMFLFFAKPLPSSFKNHQTLNGKSRNWIDKILDKFSFKKDRLISSFFIWILLIVGILMGCSGVIGGFLDHPFLGDWGALRRLEIEQGEWFRIFSYGFLSSGPVIGLINLFILASFGGDLEKLVGNFAFFLISICALVFGALVSLYYHPNYWVGGASPLAIGLILSYFLKGFELKHLSLSSVKTWIILAYLLLVFILGFINKVDHAANLGGLIGGGIGFLISKSFQKDNYGEVAKHSK